MNKNVIIHTESDDNYLCHWKYIKRYKKNGHWVYVYNDKKLSNLRENQRHNMHKLAGFEKLGNIYKDKERRIRNGVHEVIRNPNKYTEEFSDKYLFDAWERLDRIRINSELMRNNQNSFKTAANETSESIKKRKASKSVALGNKVAELLTSGSEKISKGKEYLKKLVK